MIQEFLNDLEALNKTQSGRDVIRLLLVALPRYAQSGNEKEAQRTIDEIRTILTEQIK